MLVFLTRMLPRPLPRLSQPLKAAETVVITASRRLHQRVNFSRAFATAATDGVSSGASSAERPQLIYSVFEAPGHHLEDHVERPERVRGILRALKAAKFLGPEADPALASKLRELPPSRQATLEEIALVHTYGADLKSKSAAATPQAPVAVAG